MKRSKVSAPLISVSSNSRICESSYASFFISLFKACSLVLNGNRNRVPLKELSSFWRFKSQPNIPLNGLNWFLNLRSLLTSLLTLIFIPGFVLFFRAFPRYDVCGSKITKLFLLMNMGTSVKLYTALKPSPNLPIFSVSCCFVASFNFVIFSKSSSLNIASL